MYFLWSYEILRPFPKDPGLLAFGFAQVIFVLLPFLDRSPNTTPAHTRGAFVLWYWLMAIDLIVLSVMGKVPPEGMFTIIGQYATYTFFALWVLLPIITMMEKKK